MGLNPTRIALAVACIALAIVSTGCRRRKAPVATRVWLGPSSGCAETTTHPTFGTFGCWGVNDAGQLGDGTTTSRPFASTLRFEQGKPTSLALGARHSCAVFDRHAAFCWGEGSRGQLGPASLSTTSPVATGDRSDTDLDVAVGGAHTCVKTAIDRLRCFGADDEGQLGPMALDRLDRKDADATGPSRASNEWSRGAEIRAFALGDAHTCVAFAKTALSSERVVCHGRSPAASIEPLLEGVPVTSLVAGGDHTCALMTDRTVRCWGKNSAGQLGDGTTNDSPYPVNVFGLRDVGTISAGARHTCAKLVNNTVVCWGFNGRHQLANGTTARSTIPTTVTGIVGVQQIVSGGDGSCARMGDGAVRCWGANDRGQLGDGSLVEHTVPMPIRFH